jgi:hypothetical protein
VLQQGFNHQRFGCFDFRMEMEVMMFPGLAALKRRERRAPIFDHHG